MTFTFRRFRRVRRSVSSRAGVTLVELLVAMTILTVGLLAIVGVSGSVARSLGESRSDNLAAIAAESRFEQVAGTACSSLTLNSVVAATSRNVTERWVVVDAGNNTRQVIDSVSWTTRRGTRSLVFQTLLPCRTGA
ncbi:MAG TPA: prepilin-type N-terminal cleavage/methylation domain-containing protein [Gemmatimonadaceae bacterium]|nr:prepilin-type N-terminal cleavage/methylation domain-containing protein [Gemmatimonadaceae bacterium]